MDEWALFKAAMGGDMVAARKLQRQYERLLYRVVSQSPWHPRGRLELDGAVHETWCRLADEHLAGSIDTSRKFTSRLCQVCRNVCDCNLRTERRRPRSLQGETEKRGFDPVDPMPLPDVELARLAFLHAVRECIDELPQEERLLYECKFVSCLPDTESAAALGCVKRNVHLRRMPRLRKLLRKCLHRKGYPDEEIRDFL